MKNQNTFKRTIAILLTLAVIVFSSELFGYTAFAASQTVFQSGKVTVTLYPSEKKVVVSGVGAMEDDGTTENTPWRTNSASSYTTVVVEEGVTHITSYCFSGYEALTSLTLPSTLSSIGTGAFAGCKKLTHAVVPGNTKTINAFAFDSCTALVSVTLSEGLEYIGDSAFNGCTSLASLVVPQSVKHIGSYALYIKNNAVLTLPDELEYIGYNAWTNSKNYKSLPDGINVHSGCTLTYKGSPASSVITVPDGVVCLSELTIPSNHIVTSITLPDTLKTIGREALFDCTNLFEITVPDSVTRIDEYALGYFYIEGHLPIALSPFVIYGHAGHEAERYANENDFTFVCMHEAGDFSFYPDCEEGGEAVPVCRWCKEEMQSIRIEKGAHVFGEEYKVDATCTSDGFCARECFVCGKTEKSDIVRANGHVFAGDYEIIAFPGCAEEGILGKVCAICKETAEHIKIAPTGHTPSGTWETLCEAECDKTGIEVMRCSVCGAATEERVTDAVGHEAGEFEVLVRSDLYTQSRGLAVKSCKRCGVICEYRYYLVGDADGDGAISLIDNKILKGALLGSDELPFIEIADVDNDGMLSALDLKYIQKYLLGL